MAHTNTLILLACLAVQSAYSQSKPDSIQTKALREIMVAQKKSTMEPLPAIQGAWLWSGKKSEVISVQNQDANIAERTPRQIFAKVPGVFVYDMDGTGNQVNISTRGLDPHRGWEFNIRANGVITNSDMYGYPASHFSIPMEAIERIELVRGTGALQYGAQFGGMLNYSIRKPDTTRTIGYETVNSAGSYNTLSSFHAIGGKTGKLQYYAYYNRRISTGYRANSHTDFDAQGAVLTYDWSEKLQLRAALLRSNYVYQIPGPLNDSMFHANPRASTRSRNYFSPEIFVPSCTADWAIGPNTRLSWTVSAVLGSRNSVQFDKPATTVDKIDPVTLQYAPRQVDIDHFNSYTSELRFLQQYSLFGQTSVLAAGVQYINNDLHRQPGKTRLGPRPAF
jgi:Fe(3+) dicitrate transport protein